MSPPIAISSPPSPKQHAEDVTTSTLTEAGTNDILAKTLTNDSPGYQELLASRLTVTRTTSPKIPPASPSDPSISPQNVATDHMLIASWKDTTGWSAPSIQPHGPLSIMPTASCLHYATECFEGLKVYRGQDDGKLRLFRPMMNAQRFLRSALRIALPGFDPVEFLKCLEKFVGFEMAKWLPNNETWRGRFLYLRPLMLGTGDALGVQRPREALLCVMAVFMPDLAGSTSLPAPSPGLSSTETSKQQKIKGMRLLASSHTSTRAWPGGFGYAKVGANYGPTLVAQGEARSRGFDQVLWLFGSESYVTEAGGSNFFVLWNRESDGKLELVTAPLEDEIILPGVTRDAVLDIVRDQWAGKIEVSERAFTMSEIVRAGEQGRLREAFGSGTAFFIAPTGMIEWNGKQIVLPLGQQEWFIDENDGNLKQGCEFAVQIKEILKGIMYGTVQHEWGVVVEEWDE